MNNLEESIGELDLNHNFESDLSIVRSQMNSFSDEKKQLFVDRCHSLNIYYKGSGAGMTTGTMIEKLLVEHFEFSNYNVDQNDLKVNNIPLSFKKITGCSAFSLNWGNNKEIKLVQCTSHILLLNLKSKKYRNIIYNTGFYLINKKHLIGIERVSNNRTNNLIETKNVSLLLRLAVKDDLFFRLPEQMNTIDYNLINGFNFV